VAAAGALLAARFLPAQPTQPAGPTGETATKMTLAAPQA